MNIICYGKLFADDISTKTYKLGTGGEGYIHSLILKWSILTPFKKY